MIALALFALVSLAGLALVDSVIRVEQRTSPRLDRLGELQRAMFLIERDLQQISVGSLEQADDGVRFDRHGPSLHAPGARIGYAQRGESLVRLVGQGRTASEQMVVSGVASASWSFYYSDRGWQPQMPVLATGVPEQPAAVAIEILLDGSRAPSGTLRRVVELPPPPVQALAP